VIECRLVPNDQFFSYVMERTSYFLMKWCKWYLIGNV